MVAVVVHGGHGVARSLLWESAPPRGLRRCHAAGSAHRPGHRPRLLAQSGPGSQAILREHDLQDVADGELRFEVMDDIWPLP